MAPSASMLFLSYHQLHQPPAEEATPGKDAAAAGGFRRISLLSSALSIPMFERRREAAVRERDAGEDIKSSSASAANNKELEEKFEEALRLSCWSS
jgi:hypothetical protein